MNVSVSRTPLALQNHALDPHPLPLELPVAPVALSHRIAMWLGIRLIMWSTRASASLRIERAASRQRTLIHIDSAREANLLRFAQTPKFY